LLNSESESWKLWLRSSFIRSDCEWKLFCFEIC